MNSKEREEDQKATGLDDARCTAVYHNTVSEEGTSRPRMKGLDKFYLLEGATQMKAQGEKSQL